MVDVFVSYASADRERVAPLVDRWRGEGWSVWWDRQIGGGAAWDAEIEKALEQARCTIVLWSDAAIASEWVRTEAVEALEHGKLVPILIDAVRVPLRFRRVQARDLTGWPTSHDPRELERVVADLHAMLDRREQPLPSRRRAAPSTERRQVTILRGDFIQPADEDGLIDPEVLHDRTEAIESAITAEVDAAGGTLIAFDTAGVTCAFGARQASEDDEIVAAETAFRLASIVETSGMTIRLGIASGIAVVSSDGSGSALRVTGTVSLDAAALAALASAGETLLAAATQRRLSPYFATRAVGAATFALLARTAVRSRIDAARMVGFSPLVGRRPELTALEAALDDIVESEGRAICLIGEPGLGKSRLAHELRNLAHDRDVLVIEAHCRPHGRTRAHGPFRDMLAELLRIDDISQDEVEPIVIDRLLAFDAALEPFLPHLLHLMAIDSVKHRLPDAVEGLALRMMLSQALVATTMSAARHRPILMLLEDWHCADEASQETVQRLAESCATHAVMVLACSRPEAPPVWPPLSHCSQIVLRPLGKREVTELIRALTRATEVAPELAALLHNRTDGVPLFVEELVHTMLEQGAIAVDEGILVARSPVLTANLPGSVEATVRSRLDRLDPDVIATLRAAAVIGRDFDAATLITIVDDAAAVDAAMVSAVAQGIVQQTRLVPAPEYRFRHLLTQIVAYESLLAKQRAALHGNVAEALEARHAGDLDDHLEALAHHFGLAKVSAKAIDYTIRAGERAAQAAFNTDAIALFRKAITLIEQEVDSPARDERLLHAHVALGNALILIKGYADPDVEAVYGRARDLGRTVTAGSAHFAGLWMLWRYCYNRSMVDDADDFAGKLLAIAEASDNAELLLVAATASGVVAGLAGWPARSHEALTRAIAAWKPDGERLLARQFGISPAAQAHAFLGLAEARLGRPRAAAVAFDAALSISREIDHPASEVLIHAYRRAAAILHDDLPASIEAARAMRALAERHALPHWEALGELGEAQDRLAAGDFAAIADFSRAAATVEAMGVTMIQDSILLTRALLAFFGGRAEEALAMMAEAQALGERTGQQHLAIELSRVLVIMLWPSDREAALATARVALTDAVERQAVLSGVRLAAEAARLLAADGQAQAALAILSPAWQRIDPAERDSVPVFRRVAAVVAELEAASAAPPLQAHG